MSPLPVPSLEAAEEVAHVLDELHTAWEAAGGDEEMLLGAWQASLPSLESVRQRLQPAGSSRKLPSWPTSPPARHVS